MEPDKYWKYTLRECGLIAQAYNNRIDDLWATTRNIEFSIYNSATNAMSGKRVFRTIKRPKDLYQLNRERIKKEVEVVVDLERATKARNRTNNKPSWHKT